MPVIVSANPIALAQASNAGIFGATTEFLRNRLENLAQVGGASEQFMNAAWGMYDQFHGSAVMREIRAVTQQIGSIFETDGVRYLRTIADFQQATPIMQRFIMAQPDLRAMYLKFEADGYSETYINVHGDDIGEQHHDYRLMMDGALIEEGEDLVMRMYFEEPEEHDPVHLTLADKFDGRSSWDNLKNFIQQREQDPSSIYCDHF